MKFTFQILKLLSIKMRKNSIIFMLSGLIGGFIVSLSIKKLYKKLTNIELKNIVDYEE